jgi:hypothetical protein
MEHSPRYSHNSNSYGCCVSCTNDVGISDCVKLPARQRMIPCAKSGFQYVCQISNVTDPVAVFTVRIDDHHRKIVRVFRFECEIYKIALRWAEVLHSLGLFVPVSNFQIHPKPSY